MSESILHNELKAYYQQPGDLLESRVDGYIIDLVRGDLLVEIQTKSFSALKNKLKDLIKSHKVLLVYPIVTNKWISLNGARRLSPKHCNHFNLFDELIYIPELFTNPNLSIEAVLVEVLESRERKRVSWRKNWVTKERRLLSVGDKMTYNKPGDLLKLIPEDITTPFSNKELSKKINKSTYLTRKMTYCLKKMCALKVVGKKGNSLLFMPCAI